MDLEFMMWGIFIVIVVVLLALDLGVLHRTERVIGIRESLWLSLGYFLIGCAFGGFIWFELGAQKSLEYFTGFLVEKSLSMDNIFVMSMCFTAFHIRREEQHKILFWGILGVLVLRGIMIALGATLLASFSWILYVFGAFLIFTGLHMLRSEPKDTNDKSIQESRLFQWLTKRLGIKPFWSCLIMIECMDLMFAVDSVPAIFAITQDPFIIYTSNVFAILGLRALYFALADMIHRFVYLSTALAMILVLIGAKILVHDWMAIPTWITLGLTVLMLTGGVVCSLRQKKLRKCLESALNRKITKAQ